MHNLNNELEMLKQVIQDFEKDRPVNTAASAREVLEKLDVGLSDSGCDSETLIAFAKQYVGLNPDVSQTDFFKLLYSGLNAPALFGEWVASLSNANMHTYQMSPVATLMELELIKQWNQLIGYEHGEGVLVSGGSQGNLIGMMLGRHHKVGDCKRLGLQGKTLVAYVSDQAHYSSQRAANLLGIGTDNLIGVASDEEGRLIPEELEKEIKSSLEKGHTPFYIGLTAGTTVIGAYDPIKPCAEIAKRYALWLHVDGAWGAPVLFSKDHRHLMSDVSLSDSMSWDAHKLLSVPLTASGIQVKNPGMLKDAIAGGGGEYLFHQDENADFNLGEKSIQCGRRADSLKVWMSWKANGSQGFAKKVDHLQIMKAHCVEQIEIHPRFTLLAPSAYLNILFRYEPEEALTEEQLRELNITICKNLKSKGSAFIDYASFKGRSGIRLILGNVDTTSEIVDKVLALCAEEGDLLTQ
ncbi:pyridoxal-dependent decarboxylase [Cocleimonas sp. KMM 6892]|uniref:pyridoxal phosphate-dependent decarboxylase family protein n=1 Tax=unclassified Cocleimonas TaxID=2639732 RepID=UPI002DBBCF63|nr:MULTISPECIES: pyridoxal-dependent decarboxylase [unclassified Cocleimonas]MEB8434505.1 pyridoxal-dependent decarboxylase [Cocleimonas sp. KMM 6892]MEC4717398.1 pyridoxal-dependent decarboxylase [Cocleimonas sp. KMM 6895]MEC4746808.1 pyridoxal-dependent decarboxylase [Cocleimonas sp. KMM 6896]